MTAKEYEVRVRGAVPEETLRELAGLCASVEPPQTVLRGQIRDQAALHGLLLRLQRLNIDVIELRQVPHRGEAPEALS
jgi:hypothetical protein